MCMVIIFEFIFTVNRYAIMLQCWKHSPDERPTFGNLRDLLWKLKTSENPYVNVDPMADLDLPPIEEGKRTALPSHVLTFPFVLDCA